MTRYLRWVTGWISFFIGSSGGRVVQFKGAIHLHSTYSDGERSLSEVQALFRSEGCDFAIVTDHADAFDRASIDRYVAECASLSDDVFLLIPSLEFGCVGRMHILGYGVTALCDSEDPQTVIRHIIRHGGIAVIAHPPDRLYPIIEALTELPQGIEVWNTKYDGRHAPRFTSFALLRRLQQRKADMLAFYGQDLHWLAQARNLFIRLDAPVLSRDAVLSSLVAGRYAGVKGQLVLPSNGMLDEVTMTFLRRRRAFAGFFRNTMNSLNRMRRSLGIGIPSRLKAQLCRFF
jgi:hypothetical protein